ncbi:hypothetical protein [Clostridium algidicarnis]|uniref:hypothetical protein n=1 Tax=Clostridium algidicarnis TaxID=37659 RepID=UPI001C0B4525|nr:hypothetical protein [Clostridium algidicarnis]MBU3208701.1 hypothetical protein [Clostridium algidicarnis]
MARISTIKNENAIPREDREQLSTCLFCDEKISKGGCWAGSKCIGVCKKCSQYLIDLFIDTLDDTDESFKKSSVETKMKYIEQMGVKRIVKKEEDSKKQEKYSYIKKLNLKYYAEVGIIDFFECTMTIVEAINKLSGVDKYNEEVLNGCENDVKEFIYSISREYPHTIRFFAIPDLNYGTFRLGCVAKIQNNGSTYILCGNRSYFEGIDEPGYNLTVKEVY